MSLTLNMHLDVSAGPNISIEQQLTNYIKGGGGRENKSYALYLKICNTSAASESCKAHAVPLHLTDMITL